MTYGGNEEIVLKTKRKISKSRKRRKVTEPKNVYAQRSSGILCQNTDSTEAEWEYAAADVDKENIIFTKVKRNILGQKLYSFWKRQSKEIS
jgi:hypothetical protein